MKGKVVICGVNTSVLPLLSEEESVHLLTRIKAGDENAREEFIIGNIRLVLSIIKRFGRKRRIPTISFRRAASALSNRSIISI